MAGLFINYRRDDTGAAAQAIYVQLQAEFGTRQVFMDVNTIHASDPWPDRLRSALAGSDAVLVLIGDNWLFSDDEFGRRRIDAGDDWVRVEIREALRKNPERVFPILVGPNVKMPPAKALPASIARLAACQAVRVSHETWNRDVTFLARELMEQNIVVSDPEPKPPTPEDWISRLPGLTEEELAQALSELTDWIPWRETVLREYPRQRQELRRTIIFDGFTSAMKFMNEAAVLFRQTNHHPRWDNEWRRVTIRLTTWDAGNRITTLDVDVARKVDALVADFQQRQARARARKAPEQTPASLLGRDQRAGE